MRTACDALADRAASRELRVAIAVGADATAVVDRQALLTVCRNIVRNAIDHAAPALLTIEGDRRALTFRDDGPGIAAVALPHAFEHYHQGHRADDGAASDATRRRGLGLAIARRMCDLQGWKLAVRSPPEGKANGTAFTLELAPPST